MIDVRGRLRKPSKRTSLIVAIILGIVVAGFTIGSSFGDDEIVNHLSFAGEAASEPDYQRVIADGADASSAAIASDSAKAASGLSSLWIWPSVAVPGGSGEVEQASSAEAFAERMVVFTAKIELEVGDVDSTLDDIRALTDAHGGFIASVNTRSGTGAITIRVPQASFYYAVSEIEGLTGEIQYLESRVELATITVLLNVSAELKAEWLPKVDWRAPVTAGLGALFTILQGLLSIAIVLGPFVAIGVPTYYLYKRVNGTRTSS